MKIRNLLIIISCFFIFSCAGDFYQVPVSQGNIISQEMLNKLDKGLTKTQVRYIMGTPSIKDPFDSGRWDYIGFEIIGDQVYREVHHSLFFEENKLANWVKKIGAESNDNASEEAKKLNIEK